MKEDLRELFCLLSSATHHSLGPQLSFRCIDNKLYPSKDILPLFTSHPNAKSNPYIKALIDHVSSLHRTYGTGTSSLVTYMYVLLRHLLEEERKDVKTMKKALEILASTFEQLCFLLQVEVPIRLEDPNDTHERMTDGKEIESDDDNNSVDLENIDWFFEEECKTLQTQYVNSHKVTSSPSSPSSSCRRYYEVSEFLARGLQHCLCSDYNDQCNKTNDADHEMSLPMKLAYNAFCSSTSSSSPSTVANVNIGRMVNFGTDSVCITRTYNDNRVSSDISIRIEMHRLEWERIVCAAGSDVSKQFKRVVIFSGAVDAILSKDRGSTSSSDKLNKRLFCISYEVTEMDAFSMRTSLNHRILDKLNYMEVEVLFLVQGGASEMFIDQCHETGIIVVSVPSTLLASISAISACRIASNLMYIDSSHVGGIHNPLIFRRAEEQRDGSSNDDVLTVLLSTSLTTIKNMQLTLIQSHVPIYVNIAGNCEAFRALIEDRFKRCISRLKIVTMGGGVCIGGGLPEMLTAMELQLIVKKYQSKAIHEDSDLALIPLLQQITDAILIYPITVNTANGMSWTQATLRNSFIMQTILEYVKRTNDNGRHGYDSIVEYLEHCHLPVSANKLTTCAHSFPRPIHIPKEDVLDVDVEKTGEISFHLDSLDCVLLKVESMKSAISFVASVLRTI